MTYICKELDKTFETKKELFTALKDNKQRLVGLKKANILESRDKGTSVKLRPLKDTTSEKSLNLDRDYLYLAVNTTGVLDSHNDLHIKGIWNKTVKDQQGKNYLVLDHSLTVSNTAVDKSDIEMLLMDLPFSAIGKNYEGNTQALVYKFKKESIINETAKMWLEKGFDIEASVRMQYVNVELAINDDSTDFQDEYKTYLNNIDNIANKNDFTEISYFWVVKEAKNVSESSLVLNGSNSSTGFIESKIEPSEDTQEKKPSEDTSKEIDYKYIKGNFKLN